MSVTDVPGRGTITLPEGLDRTGDGRPLRFAVTLSREFPGALGPTDQRVVETDYTLESVIGALLTLLDHAETEDVRLDDVAGKPSIALAAYVDARQNGMAETMEEEDGMSTPTLAPERVTVVADDWWVCLCGNQPDQDGFQFCDRDGNEVEPTEEEWPEPLYVCGRCHRIVKQGTGTVIGRRRGPEVVG